MLFLKHKISEQKVSDATVAEMRSYVSAAVEARRDDGRERAVQEAARDLNMSPRRVVALLRSEVRRVWADELESARRWYRDYCDREVRRLEAKAQLLRARRAAFGEGPPPHA